VQVRAPAHLEEIRPYCPPLTWYEKERVTSGCGVTSRAQSQNDLSRLEKEHFYSSLSQESTTFLESGVLVRLMERSSGNAVSVLGTFPH
jgi:hypothetical protein